MDWKTCLAQRLSTLRPDGVCALDEAAERFAAAVLPDTPRTHLGAPSMSGALALGIDALDRLDGGAARHLIHRVRLYAAPRILLVAHADCALDDNDFRSLGFVLEAMDSGARIRLQSYDLASYKPVPDWLNARFWAHPERWEP